MAGTADGERFYKSIYIHEQEIFIWIEDGYLVNSDGKYLVGDVMHEMVI